MLHSTESQRRSSGNRRRRAVPRPFLEILEDRTLLDTSGMLRIINPDYLAPRGPYRLPEPPHVSPALRLPSPFPNVLVNDPGEDGRSAQDTQSETTLVLGDNNTVVVAYNDSFLANSLKYTSYSQSTDGGLSFVDKRGLPTNINGDLGDPVLARDEVSGRIYLSTLSFNGGVINVFRSDDNGATFRAPVNGAPRGDAFWDKDWMAVDNFPGPGQENVYLVARDFNFFSGGIALFRSTNGGDTWTPNGGGQVVSAGLGNVQGAWVTVGPDHAVYVSWLDERQFPDRIMMRKSTDGGLNFGPEREVTKLRTTRINGDLDISYIRSNTFPQVAVNPANGDLYIAYNDKGTAAPDRADVFFRQSTNGGMTWSAAVKVNDDGTNRDQWQPTLAVSPAGNRVGIFWYDRRNDPDNYLIDRYGVIGSVAAHKVTFAASFRITDQAFPPVVGVDPVIVNTYMGDYDQAVGTLGHFYVTWGDNRSQSLGHAGNNADVRFASILVAAGPAVVASTPHSDTFSDVGSVRVTFDEAIQVPTFTPDKIKSFTGPGGSVPVTGVSVIPNTGNTQFEISFATQHSLGKYSMVIGPDILDAAGHPMDQNDNGIPGETSGDQYTAKLTIQGPKIIASTPADRLLGPVSSTRVNFNEPVDPATFTRDSIFAFQGPKGSIDITAVTAVVGSNNRQFDVTFAPQGTIGRYEMDIGPNIADLAGHLMDQNGNFIEGEVPGDRYVLQFALLGPRIVSSPPTDTLFGALSNVLVTFNEPMAPATFTPDKIARFTRTVGATVTDLRPTLTSITPVAGSNNQSFNINFIATGTTGRYLMVIGPDVRDLFGNPMDQNQNLIPGEIPGDQYSYPFNLGGPQVLFAQPNNTLSVFSVRVGFNVTMDVASFTSDKITNFTGARGENISVLAVLPVFGTGFKQFDILFPLQRATGHYLMVIGPDIRDLFGNPMDQNGNLIPGEIPQDKYTARFGILGPQIIASTPSSVVFGSVDHVRVTFNEPMDVSMFTPDKIPSFTGPAGPLPVTNVSVVPLTGNTQFDIMFDPQNVLGSYTMVIGPTIPDLYGNLMDQNNNLVPGEVPGDQFTVHFGLYTAGLIENGDFEAAGGSFTGWSIMNQAGSLGNWFLQMGTTSPVSGFDVPAPPGPTHAAMTDTNGFGSHILFQDFVVPTGITAAILVFDQFIGNRADAFFTPDTLDFNANPNQQARVDIISTTADPFSVLVSDVLLNVFQTKPGDPLISGYTTQTTDLTNFLAAHEGETLRLRFAEVDNQFYFQFGVDRIILAVNTTGGGGAAGFGRSPQDTQSETSLVLGDNKTVVVALAGLTLTSAGDPWTSPGATATTLAKPVSATPDVRNIDWFFSSAGKKDAQAGLALLGRWQDGAVPDIFGKESVVF